MMFDDEIVAQLIKCAGGNARDNMLRDKIEDLRGEFARAAHRVEVIFGMNGN